MSDDMTHRWFTPALLGAWCASAEEALFDALQRGQAVRKPDPDGPIVLRPFAAMEVRAPPSRTGRPASPPGEAAVTSGRAGPASR